MKKLYERCWFYLKKEHKKYVKKEAKKTGRTESDIVREIITNVMK